MSELFESAIVQKRNVLNDLRSNNMTIQELRFFSIYLSKINQKDISTRCVRFPIEDFQRIMGFGKLNLGQLRASTDSLLCKLVHIPDENGKGMRTFQLFKECHIFQDTDEKWYMEIDAHDKALPLMFDFKDRYFKYELWNALRLKSSNQIRMYEILKQYEYIGKRELPVTELRELLGVSENEYSGRTGWSDFKRYVLDSCQDALQHTTDIAYTYERGKAGRGGKWISVIFHIQKNHDYISPLTLDKFIGMQCDSGIDDDDKGEIIEISSLFDDKGNDSNIEDEDLLSMACSGEFSETERQCILEIVKNKSLPPHQYGTEIARFHYIKEMYSKLNVYAEKNNITDRFAYFCKMIENDERY